MKMDYKEGIKKAFRVATIVLITFHTAYSKTSIVNLTCEYAKTPLGIDVKAPRFGWIINSDDYGFTQTAYQILVADNLTDLSGDKGNVWDSGIIPSSESVAIVYKGEQLKSRQRYYWKVKIWDSNKVASQFSDPEWFEMGLLSPDDWQAIWVGFTAGMTGQIRYFNKKFNIDKPIQRCTVYIAGIGYYELRLNGNKVDDHVLDPGTTSYNKRVLYNTYDINELLVEGDNTLGVVVAPGWYGMSKLLLQMELYYNDSTKEIISTGGPGWRISVGPVVESTIYDGETYDARLENPSWDKTTSTNFGRMIPLPIEPPGGALCAQMPEPIRIVESRRAKKINEPRPGVFVFDAGQNLAGWAKIISKGAAGTKITMRFAENLYEEGTINQENLRTAKATDVYILKGDGEEIWEPRFTYHGFRYIQIEGYPGTPTLDDLIIRVVRSDVNPAGSFKCSNKLLNRIQTMVWWTEASNLHSIPTDCPQRDERMGWLNDLTVRIEEAMFNFDMARFYPKYMNDIKDTQSEDGAITCTAPFKFGYRPAAPVSASYVILPWMLYKYYNDTLTIANHYQGVKSWVDLLSNITDDGIVTLSRYGDWSPPVKFGTKELSAYSRVTPGAFMSTGYLYYCANLMVRMADLMGIQDDVATYRKLAENTRNALNRAYWNEESGGYANNNQSANSFALFLGIVDKENIPRVVENLVQNVIDEDYHLTTGNLCTKYLLEMLTEYGHVDEAYRIATQKTYPGWGYMLANGATTLWERWEYETGGAMNSHNHPMMGSVSSWFYKYLAGIQPDAKHPAFKQSIIKPYFPSGLNWVNASYDTKYGKVKSSWEKNGSRLGMKIKVPANTNALVYFPVKDRNAILEGTKPIKMNNNIEFIKQEGDRMIYKVKSGEYSFKMSGK